MRPPKSELVKIKKRRLSYVIVRVTPNEREFLKRKAEKAGMTYSNYIRRKLNLA